MGGGATKSRKNYADALATITPALVKSAAGKPDAALLRRALYGWAYNRNRWNEEPPEDVAQALKWLGKNSLPVSALEDAATVRVALDALGLKIDGKPAAPRTARRKRACLSDVLGLAVEERYFTMPVNPLTTVKWVAPKSAEEVDPQSVANPRQARAAPGRPRAGAAASTSKRSSGASTTRPCGRMEATALRDSQCHLPETGWGALTLREGAVRAGRNWTDDGEAHEMRHLKARAVKDSRPVPIPPHFVRLLRQHIATYGVAPDGRLFRTSRGGLLQETGYGEVWARARKDVLTEREHASLLARRPYDLRHAGVSFWLSSGVDPMECARRAGHTIAVLFRVYAKVLAQTQQRANDRIDAALREWNEPE